MYSAEYATNHPTRDEIQGIVEPTVLEFGSPDCPHCQEAEPKVKAAFQDFPGHMGRNVLTRPLVDRELDRLACSTHTSG